MDGLSAKLNDDDLFLVGCVKLSAIKTFMCETAGNNEIARAFLKYALHRNIAASRALSSTCFCEEEGIWTINLNTN